MSRIGNRVLTIPSNVKTINENVFIGCCNLETIYVLNENINNGKLLNTFCCSRDFHSGDNVPIVYVTNKNIINDHKRVNNSFILF